MNLRHKDINTRAAFVDANAFVYFLDETSEYHDSVVALFQGLVDRSDTLFTSHHVIEEVLFIVSRLTPDRAVLVSALDQIMELPGLELVEPEPTFDFARDYVRLYQSSKAGINDTLLLQLMIDAGITSLLSYDLKFLEQAELLGISSVS